MVLDIYLKREVALSGNVTTRTERARFSSAGMRTRFPSKGIKQEAGYETPVFLFSIIYFFYMENGIQN